MRETLKNIFFGSYFRLAAFCVGLAALPIFLALASNEIFTHRQRAELIFNLAVDLSAATHAQQRDLEADITAMLKALGRNNAVYNGYEATKDASFQRALIAWGLSNLVDNLVLYSASGESKAWSTTVPRPLDERFKGIFNRGIISDDVIISHADNAEELLFVLPLRNSLGGVYSFLVASVGLGHYLDLIRDINMNGMFNVVLYAQDGHWLLADEKTRSEYLMALSSRHSGAMSYNAEYADMLRRLVPSSGNSAVIISNADGQRFIAAFSHLRVNLADSSYLSTVLLADYGKFFADLRNNLWRSLIWLSTAFGIMSLIILVSCLYFFKHPLRKLLDVSRRLSEGDLSAAAELSVINGAFAEYAHGLQNIAESLQKREEELSCARRNAELSTQYKTEFFANISHEIRTPMNAILGMTYLVLKSDLSPMQMDYINKIQTSGKNLLHIINDILDFSKLEDGDISMESSLFSIRDVFTFISGNYSRRLREKNIHLVTDIASDTPLTLTGDPLRLEQALSQLMDNAVNHTSNGTIRLGCSMVGIARDDCSLRITVADTGEGMRPEFLHLLEQVLGNEDIYVQKWREQGYGLGLPLVCRIFRLMNGNMHISSELGRGTVCVCTAHFAYNEDDQRQNNILSNKRALLCDLDLSSRAMHVNLLNSFSMQVSEFSSVLPALSELAEADAHGAGYDFFILSRCSDGLDNHEIIRHVRQEMHLSKIPQIIAISHFGRDDAIYVMKKSGVDACLHVPINGSLMFDALAMLDGADGASPLDQDGCFTADSISSFTGMRVLLVEDNRLHQQMAVTLMEEAGMEVTAVFNGSEALKALSVCRDGYGFDLVLMDMQMPEMDGFETTWRIRKDSYLNAVYIPIIALTAHRGTHEVNAYRKIGMDDHVPKPVDREVFFTVLHRWLPLAADNSGESVKFLRELGQLLESDAHKASKRFSEYGRHLRRSLGGGRAGKLRRMIDEQEYGKAGDFITHLLDKLDGYLTEQPYDSTERDKAADHIFD